MALFNRLFTHVQKKKEISPRTEEESVWHNYAVPGEHVSVRIVLFRECERKGKKLLFDSDSVGREPITPEVPLADQGPFTEINDGYGFVYLPPGNDVKLLSEMILGSVAVTHQVGNLKIHQLPGEGQDGGGGNAASSNSSNNNSSNRCSSNNSSFNSNQRNRTSSGSSRCSGSSGPEGGEGSGSDGGRTMWSSIIQAPRITNGVKSSNSSLGSSFGCSIGSFQSSEPDDCLPLFPELLERVEAAAAAAAAGGGDRTDSCRRDSGCYPSFSSCHLPGSFASSSSGASGTNRRRLSSHVDTLDYGSLCSLQRRWWSATVDSGAVLYPGVEVGSPPPPPPRPPVNFQISPNTSSSQRDGQNMSRPELDEGRLLKQGGKNALLGLGMIVRPLPGHAHLLFTLNTVLEDIYNHLVHTVQQAYIQKKRFVVTVYNGYLECLRQVEQMFVVPRLRLSAWHLVLTTPVHTATAIGERLVNEICHLKKILDTKETNFLFSTLLTGILTHHLGWVATVMPGVNSGECNILEKPPATGIDTLRTEQWYNPGRMQVKELRGMLGNPAQSAQSLILCNKEDIGKSLVFVLSYFLRCSLVYQQQFEATNYDSLNTVQYKPYIIRECEKLPPTAATNKPKLSKSNSSPSIDKKCHAAVNTLEALDLSSSAPDSHPATGTKVGFVIGEDEASPASNTSDSLAQRLTREDRLSEEEPERLDEMYVTHVPVDFPRVVKATPADLSSLVCYSDQFTAGSVLQACKPDSFPNWKTTLQADLQAVSGNSLVSLITEECVCVVGDIEKREVSLVSAQQVVVGRPGLPVPMSPLVASLLDGFTAIASLGLPVATSLNYLEDQLQQLYLQSCVLAEYLLSTDYRSLQSISKDLDLDPCDIPLLLAVSSSHTPEVGTKFGLGFTG